MIHFYRVNSKWYLVFKKENNGKFASSCWTMKNGLVFKDCGSFNIEQAVSQTNMKLKKACETAGLKPKKLDVDKVKKAFGINRGFL